MKLKIKIKTFKPKYPIIRKPQRFVTKDFITVALFSDGTLHRILDNGQHIKIS
jgi:hypothetical protein